MKKFRERIGYNLLLKRMKKLNRKVMMSNFEKAQSIGIVCNIKNKDEEEFVKKFKEGLLKGKKKVTSVCYYSKGLSKSEEETHSDNEICLSNRSTNIFYQPKSEKITEFCSKPVDLLIDLCNDKVLPLNYVVGLSSAGLKVGISNNNNTYCDIIIDKNPESKLDVHLNQVKHYLSLLSHQI